MDIAEEGKNLVSRVPSMTYVVFAISSMALSAAIATFSRRKTLANFVGLWVPTLLLFGVYNKLTRLESTASEASTLH